MTREELQKELDAVWTRVQENTAAYKLQDGKDSDRMDWYERALEMMDAGEATCGLQALIAVDKFQPSDSYNYDAEVDELHRRVIEAATVYIIE